MTTRNLLNRKVFGSACWARTSDPLINSQPCYSAETRENKGFQPTYEVAQNGRKGPFLPTFEGCRATCILDSQIKFQCRIGASRLRGVRPREAMLITHPRLSNIRIRKESGTLSRTPQRRSSDTPNER